MIKMSAQQAKNFQILSPNTNRALALALKNATPKELQTLTQTQDLATMLQNLLKHSSSANDAQNKALLALLQNNPTLKSLSNAAPDIQALLTLLKGTTQDTKLEKILQNFLSNIQDIEPKALQKKLQSSGVFLESSLKKGQNPKEILADDLKAQLLKTHEQLSNAAASAKTDEILKQVDKLLLKIDYHQMLSSLSNAASLFIPYSWDALQEGSLHIKKHNKKSYTCAIHLTLKAYGRLDLQLLLQNDRQLSMSISTPNETLKERIKQNMPQLKKALTNAALVIQNIHFIKEKQHLYEDDAAAFAMGFEVKA
jgi:hypothetical protein